MKKYIKYISFIIVFTATLMACSDDFLESNNAGLLAKDEFYLTDDDAIQSTMAVYDILQWHYSDAWTSPYFVKTMPSDESNAGGSGASDQPAYQRLDDFLYDATNSAVLGAWQLNYFGIARANLVIGNVTPDSPLKLRSIAEAKALRAFYYADLVSLFGDVPLVRTELKIEEWDQERVSKEEVYEMIEQDLQEAIPDLPLKSELSLDDKFRVSKGVAYTTLGKAHLYQEEWAEAAAAFQEVINSGEYDLDPDFGHIFTLDGELGLESIFEVQYVSTQGNNWGNFPWDDGRKQENNIHLQLMGPRGDFYTGTDSLIGGWGFNIPRESLFDVFESEGDSMRKVNTLMSEQELKDNGGDWTNPDAHDYTGYIRRKYGTYEDQTDTDEVAELNYGTNWRIFRYADVLLMAAEAYYRSGNEGQALIELNKVRQRALLPNVSAGGNALFEAIVRERQMELAFEGVRFLDLVRWNMAEEKLGSLGFKKGKHELFPIPDLERQVAPKLTQNPGY